MSVDSPKTQRILKHLSFWLFILAFQISRSGSNFIDFNWQDFKPLFIEHTLMLPILMAASYFFAFFLWPVYFSTRRYFLLIIFSIAGGAIAVMVMRVILYFYVFPNFYPTFYHRFPGFWNFNLSQYTFYIFSTVAMVVMLKYTSQLRRMEKIKEQLEKQNLISELALLRSQINPHFLFNTLNNINVLVGKNPELTRQSIIKLSDIMRYMLVEATNEKVFLANEIEYLKNYIGLLSLRLEKIDFISFTIKGDAKTILIPPMLLIPFIENAFKHGHRDTESPGIIIILDINRNKIRFSVENLVKPYILTNTPDSHGIGIANLERRIELLYPGRHKLNINSDGKIFRCELELIP